MIAAGTRARFHSEGLVAVQQFIRIGMHAFIAGGSLVRKNVPPYVKAAREPLSYAGVNTIGLKRRSFTNDQIQHIHPPIEYHFLTQATCMSACQIA